MSIQIAIRGTVINFPSSSAAPNWAPSIIQFAQEVESALQLAIGTFDVAPQTMSIDSYNVSSLVDIPNLTFPTSNVRSAVINISVVRSGTSPSVTVTQTSEIDIVYNPTNPTNNKWEIAQSKVGDASIAFSITDVGQVQFTTTSITSGTHTGVISFTAKALQQ